MNTRTMAIEEAMTIAETIEYLKTLKQDSKLVITDYEGRIDGFTKKSITNHSNKVYVIY